MELMARVEALLRRASGQSGRTDTFTFGDLSADFKKGEVRRKGKLLEMSARELKLLQYMIEHRGEVIPRDRLLDEVWGYDEAPMDPGARWNIEPCVAAPPAKLCRFMTPWNPRPRLFPMTSTRSPLLNTLATST